MTYFSKGGVLVMITNDDQEGEEDKKPGEKDDMIFKSRLQPSNPLNL